MARRRKKNQTKIIDEMITQLIDEAERWGKISYYTPLKLEEMALEQGKKLKGELLAEKSNLEYEMNMLGTNKKEVLIRIERLEAYIKKVDKLIMDHEKRISKILEPLTGDKKATQKAESIINKKPKISVLIGG